MGSHVVSSYTKISIVRGKKIIERTVEIEITKKSDNWIANIEIPFKLGNEPSIINATVLDADQREVRKIKKKEFEVKSDIAYGSFYEDEYVKYINMSWNTFPYRIKYSYKKVVSEFLYVCNYTPYEYWSLPVNKAILITEWSPDYQVGILTNTIEKSDSLITNEIKKYSWQWDDLPALKYEKYAPPIFEYAPKVLVSPKTFKYDIEGSQSTWTSYGQWLYELQSGLGELTPEEKSTIDKLISTLKNEREIIGTLHRYMQNTTRYVYVGLETGGLKPYSASYVCKNKFGDCKALTNYMQAALHYAGIDSYQVDVFAGDNPRSIIPLPGQQFNHVILAVPVESNDTLWLENTSDYLPFDYTGTFVQKRKGLLIKDSSSALVDIPALTINNVSEIRNTKIDITENGGITFISQNSYGGPEYETLLYVNNEYSSQEKIEHFSKIIPLQHFQIDSSGIKNSSNSHKIDTYAHGFLSQLLLNTGKYQVLPPFSFELLELEIPIRRTQPVRINTPKHVIDTIEINYKNINNTPILPDSIEIISKYGLFKESIRTQDSMIIIRREYQLFSDEYDLNEYPAFFSFNQEIIEKRKSFITILNTYE